VIYRAVLDTSAVAAYAAGSDHVGELLAEFSDERIRFAVPVACLAEARAADADLRRLHALAAHPWSAVVGMSADDDWVRLGAGVRLLGGVGRACAALIHLTGDAGYVATRDPDVYGDGIDTVQIFD
jgi:hypothetical protein